MSRSSLGRCNAYPPPLPVTEAGPFNTMFAKGCRKVGPQKSSLFMKKATFKKSQTAEGLRRSLLKLAKVQPLAAARIAAERGITL